MNDKSNETCTNLKKKKKKIVKSVHLPVRTVLCLSNQVGNVTPSEVFRQSKANSNRFVGINCILLANLPGNEVKNKLGALLRLIWMADNDSVLDATGKMKKMKAKLKNVATK